MFTQFEKRRFWVVAVIGFALVISGADVGRAQEWSIGDTTSFYFFDFHFFTNYYRTPMTLRDTSEHCYVWTQDSQWAKGRYIDSTGVVTDSIVDADSIRIDWEDVHTISAAFDKTSPAADDTAEGILSSTASIYEKLTSVYGPPPDVDDDSLIYILIIDCTEAIGAAATVGYFDPVNQLALIDNEFSNYHEMIYIDSYPFDPSAEGPASVAQQFTHLLQYGNDPGEECWIHEGLTYLSQFLCGNRR